MKGEFVVLRTFTGPVVRRIWEADHDYIAIATSENFERLSQGSEGLRPVIFKRRDAFKYTPKLEQTIASGKVDWKTLEPY
jgi:hypothetical protein